MRLICDDQFTHAAIRLCDLCAVVVARKIVAERIEFVRGDAQIAFQRGKLAIYDQTGHPRTEEYKICMPNGAAVWLHAPRAGILQAVSAFAQRTIRAETCRRRLAAGARRQSLLFRSAIIAADIGICNKASTADAVLALLVTIYAYFSSSRARTALRNVRLLTPFRPQRFARSPVIVPAFTVSRQAFSRSEANF